MVGGKAANRFTLGFFLATLAVEMLAFYQVVKVRKLFSPSDLGRTTWTLIMAFLAARLIGEVRLATLSSGLIPYYTEGGPVIFFYYEVVLRYVYTLSDALFIVALVTTIRAYKSTGLSFHVARQDYLFIGLVWLMPVVTYVFRENLIYASLYGTSPLISNYIVTYRLVTAVVSAIIVSLCIVIWRYAAQMGGGAIARVWQSVVVAGIARGGSFVVLALLSRLWQPGSQFCEQYLLWVFACCWLIAALRQSETVPKTEESLEVSLAPSRAMN